MADFAITQDDMKDLNDEQQGKIFDALVTSAWADGNVSKEEMDRFEKEVVKIPWGKDNDTLIKMISASKDRVTGLKDRESVMAFIKDIAEKLPKQELREKIVYTMSLIMFTDRELNAAEQNVLAAFAESFGVGKDRLQAIATAVRAS